MTTYQLLAGLVVLLIFVSMMAMVGQALRRATEAHQKLVIQQGELLELRQRLKKLEDAQSR